MQSTDLVTPLAIQTPIAVNGDKNIPAQNASGTETSSINLGFLPITSEPLDDGGIAPERTDFNGMFYLSTDQRVYLQNGGVITYDSNVASAIGGYPLNAILGYIDSSNNLGFVRSLIDNNQYNFVTTPSYINGTYWEYVNLKNFDILTPQFTTLQNNINTLDTSVVKLSGNQSVSGTKTFSGTVNVTGTAKVPNSATAGTAVSTQAISKTATTNTSAYVQLGNGLIIQWMKFTHSTNSAEHTWKKAFSSSTSYVTILAQCKGGSSAQNIAVTAQTSSKFTVYAENVERVNGLYAVGIGY